MLDLDARRIHEDFGRQVAGAAAARAAEVQALAFALRDQVFEGFEARAGMRAHQQTRRHHDHDGPQVCGLERHVFVDVGVDREGGVDAKQHGVAIGRTFGDKVGPDVAARAGFVFGHHRLFELGGDGFTHRAG